MKVNGNQNCLVLNIFHNRVFYATQKKGRTVKKVRFATTWGTSH